MEKGRNQIKWKGSEKSEEWSGGLDDLSGMPGKGQEGSEAQQEGEAPLPEGSGSI